MLHLTLEGLAVFHYLCRVDKFLSHQHSLDRGKLNDTSVSQSIHSKKPSLRGVGLLENNTCAVNLPTTKNTAANLMKTSYYRDKTV